MDESYKLIEYSQDASHGRIQLIERDEDACKTCDIIKKCSIFKLENNKDGMQDLMQAYANDLKNNLNLRINEEYFKFEEKFKFIEEEIEIRIESLKMKLDELNDTFQKNIDGYLGIKERITFEEDYL
jgi:hypothetical protein